MRTNEVSDKPEKICTIMPRALRMWCKLYGESEGVFYAVPTYRVIFMAKTGLDLFSLG